jgi:hypothetical protein
MLGWLSTGRVGYAAAQDLSVGCGVLSLRIVCARCFAQVVCVYVDADTGSLDSRIRQQAELDEQQLQALLSDAAHQKCKLQALQEEQGQLPQEMRIQGPSAASVLQSSPDAAAAGSRGVAAAAAAGVAGPKAAATGVKPIVQLPAAVTQPSTPGAQTARSHHQQQPWLQQPASDTSRNSWLHCVENPDKQLQVCYTHIKGLLAKHWPSKEQFQPGLLLLQHHPASAALAPAPERPASSRQTEGSGTGAPSSANRGAAAAASTAAAAAAAAAAVPSAVLEACISAAASNLGLDEDVFHTKATVLRQKALTAASAQLVLPRGRHLLQLQCPQSQLHCVTFHASSDFTLDTADKLLPTCCKMHILREGGDTQPLLAGSRQLLFRCVPSSSNGTLSFILNMPPTPDKGIQASHVCARHPCNA